MNGDESILAAARAGRDVRPRRPAAPTATRPGSRERVEVYAARIRRGEEIFHPGDLDGCAGRRRATIS